MHVQGTKKFYTGKEACKRIGAPGDTIPTPKLPGYVVFIQSMGIGRRPLEAGSRILYDRQVHTCSVTPYYVTYIIQYITINSHAG